MATSGTPRLDARGRLQDASAWSVLPPHAVARLATATAADALRRPPPGRARKEAERAAFRAHYGQRQAQWEQRGAAGPPSVTAVLAQLAQRGLCLPRPVLYRYCTELGLALPSQWCTAGTPAS